jgi:hypothetical protein
MMEEGEKIAEEPIQNSTEKLAERGNKQKKQDDKTKLDHMQKSQTT